MLEPPKSTSKNKHEDTNIGLCPRFHYAVELIGKRWTGAIITVLLRNEASETSGTRFHDIRSSIPELSDRMLSERLKELEVAGIITREVYPETPVRVVYKLTTKGQALKPIMDEIGDWSQTWVE